MKRSRDGLYRRGGVFAFRYQDADGRWREKFTGKSDRAAAKEFRQNFEEDLRKGTLPTNKSRWTVEQACAQWVEDHAAHLKSAKAQANEQSYLRQLIRVLGRKTLADVTLDDLKRYQRERSKKVQARPINIELAILVAVLKEANLWKGNLLHYKRMTEPESEIGVALTVEQLQHLEATAAKNDAWLVAYSAEVLAANSGLRGGEIKKLRMGQVDLENRRITVRRESTKTNAGARIVELNQAATEAACQLYKRAHTHGAIEPEHYLLPADLSRHTKAKDPLKGRRGFDATYHQMSWNTAWRNLRKEAAAQVAAAAKKQERDLTPEERESIKTFETLRFHDMRHTFITLMAERGVPLPVVQAMVGHMTEAMVRHYSHISSRAAREAVELLDANRRALVGNLVGRSETSQAGRSKMLN